MTARVATRDLASEIAAWLAGHTAATAGEVARGVGARTIDVRDTLHHDRRFTGPHTTAARPGRRIYQLAAPVPAQAAGTAGTATSAATQCQRLLAVLSDGRPHRSLDLYRMGLGVVHSRVADLRARGHQVACWLEVTGHGDRVYLYRLEQPR